MPSRPLPPPPPPPPPKSNHHHHNGSSFLYIAAAASSALILIFLLLLFVYRCLSLRRRRSPTLPIDFNSSPILRRYSYRHLRRATASFAPSRLLGRGASASVFLAVFPDGKSVAVKSLSPSAPDPDFRNELLLLSSLPPSPFVLPLLGYSLHRRLLVYEYMPNGSLQEALFGPALLAWDRRFSIILDVARGLEFLHSDCDPPVVHGDIKPSNVLLGPEFRAKIADFGLARLKTTAMDPAAVGVDEFSQDLGFFPSQELCCSPVTTTTTTVTPQSDFEFCRAAAAAAISASPSSSCNKKNNNVNNELEEGRIRSNPITMASIEAPKGKEAAVTPLDDELCSAENSKELNDAESWWWKQEGSGELSSRDYVREWIGSKICPSSNPDWENEERRRSDLDVAKSKNDNIVADSCSKKSGSVKEWWKEEYFAEMSKKSKCNKGMNWFRKSSSSSSNNNNNIDRELNVDVSFRKGGWKTRKKRSKSMGSEMFSGDLFSRELSSTATSMRGTICYVAPEHGGCGHLMEKADIYSFGVLILVIVSGRRPLHVLSSPMKLERANLISWCRQLASSGNVLDLVDERLRDSFDKEQVNMCINLALLCLQKMPELRPDGGEIVRILKGEMDVPVVPFEFSPSPNFKMLHKSRRKAARDPE